jgi:hypothetical protein
VRTAGKRPCFCYRCRYLNWLHKIWLRKRLGMKRMPPAPEKPPSRVSIPCSCTACTTRACGERRRRKLVTEKRKRQAGRP